MTPIITPEIANYIKANYLKYSSRKLAAHCKISKSPVQQFLRENGLKVPPEVVAEWKLRNKESKVFTAEQQQYIRDNIATLSVKAIARHFKRCAQKTSQEAHRLGFSEIMKEKELASRLQKGNVPHSKGKKIEEFMKPQTVAKFKANQYKKGDNPHNALEVGTETLRTDKTGIVYTMIKVEGYRTVQLKHRIIWQEHHKIKVPKGHNIVFKDGDTFNFAISNLECVSNTDLMLRNTIRRYPADLQKTMTKVAKLKKLISKKQKNENHQL